VPSVRIKELVGHSQLLNRHSLNFDYLATLYTLAKRLLQVLSVSMFLHPSVVPNTPDTNYERTGRAMIPIEVTFVAIIIMVLKMTYGLDGKAR
jgi:RNA polymerase I-specific transcription initiation factor RRN7